MNPKIDYPQYQIELPEGIMQACVDMAPKLLSKAGFNVGNDRFLSALKGKAGIRIDGPRVYFDEKLVNKYVDKYINIKSVIHYIKKNLHTITKYNYKKNEL